MIYVERCLYEYRANCALVEKLREESKDLMSVCGYNYESRAASPMSDPVSERTSRLLNMEQKIKTLEKRIRPVEKLMDGLTGSAPNVQQMRGVLMLTYIEHNDDDHVKREMSISTSTLYRRRMELIKLARKYFGESE